MQAATNTLMGHFFSLCCSLWLLQVVGEGQGPRFQVAPPAAPTAPAYPSGGAQPMSG